MYTVHHDPKRARLFLEAAGVWDLAEALAFYTDVTAACRDAARIATPVTILADISHYVPQSGPVADTHQRTILELARIARKTYAMIAPMALGRMHARRLLAEIDCQICEDRPNALAAVGWSEDYYRLLPHVAETAAPAALGRAA